MSIVSAFTSAILPILAIMGLGYLLSETLDIALKPLNDVALYAFLPALVFHNLATTSLGGAVLLKVVMGVVAFVAAMWTVAEVVGRTAEIAEPFRSADVLAAMFPNAGFYGVPLAAFAFGEAGRTTAILWMTLQSFLMYTVGVYVASRGGGETGWGAVGSVFRLPLIYAILLALIARVADVVPSETGVAMQTVQMIGEASIPLMLVVVGIRLAEMEHTSFSGAISPSVLRLFVAPAVALAVALALAFDDPTIARTFVVLSATPVAVVPLALVITYSDDPGRDGRAASEHLTTTIFVTTLASVPVLTVLITVMQSGAIV
ncbi:AEC family transporter [Halopenitus salinus]|jgi:predicted permease|uniref:AEC family transporter n=1 Tax=Halopenitus salinus TaxID=1198295 RepID=A0ABD5UUE5_9EURY